MFSSYSRKFFAAQTTDIRTESFSICTLKVSHGFVEFHLGNDEEVHGGKKQLERLAKDLQLQREGRPMVEAQVLGYSCFFDLYRMLEIDLESGNQRSIAWIDADGNHEGVNLSKRGRTENVQKGKVEESFSGTDAKRLKIDESESQSSRWSKARNVAAGEKRAMLAEVDENGEKHVILCRVILGRCEKVEVGSLQSYPSSAEFDTGVDDLDKVPKHGAPHPSTFIAKLLNKLRGSLALPQFGELQTSRELCKEGKLRKDFFMKKIRSLVADDVLRSAIQEIRG
ncbi:hypothetical protein SASPL_115536 [Salvia splendens]|uniref:RST domain-containing protein n=1 Tax=Salvia splendens TaxID=180675 RepID=A0A8X9A1D8_SALSN|nr:hypothetical protein SASPL_115536 [Salvia splendens]